VIEQELILLGILREGPAHGYQIKKKINEVLSLFTGVELKSIYYPLKVLEKKGVLKKEPDKSGKRPERFIYILTPKGESRFQELLQRSFLDFKRPQFSLDISLYFLHYIKPKLAKRRLRARLMVLARLIKGLKGMIASSAAEHPVTLRYILEHNLKMVEAEFDFLNHIMRIL